MTSSPSLVPGAWGAFFAAGLGAIYASMALGGSGEIAVVMTTVVAGLLLVVLERLRPHRPEWRVPDGQLRHDLGHFVVSFGLGTFGGTWLAQALCATPLWPVWPARWPIVLQVVLGLVVAEFFGYWQHRALHSIGWLWPLHALHHSTERMTFFKATRIHALDIGSFTFLSVASLLIVGAPAGVVLWVTAFGNFAAQSQHANVTLRTPAWLNAIVGTPAVHWLHHSIETREGNSNFGMNLMLFDHLFGTFVPPAPHLSREIVVGIADDPVPRTFLGQLALPWQIVRAVTDKLARWE